MDPYNPNNPYGYPSGPPNNVPPPGYPGAYGRPGFIPPMNYNNPGYGPPPPYGFVPNPYGPPPGIPPPFISRPNMPVPTSMPIAQGPILTLFIGSINKGVSDESMEKVLKCFGNLIKWKRLKDPSNNSPKSFGFADFSDPQAILLISIIAKDKQLKLPSPNEGVEPKNILIKYEEDVEKAIEKYKRENKIKELNPDLIEEVWNKVQQIISEMEGYIDPSTIKEDKISKKKSKKVDVDSDDSDFSEEERIILRNKEQDIQRQRDRSEEYYENLKRWEERELYRGKAYEKSRIRDREVEERRDQDRAEHFIRFKEWDDDKEMELGREDYYKDRTRWWEKRKVIRQRELENDELDRIKEKRENQPNDVIEEEQKQEEEDENALKTNKLKLSMNVNPIIKNIKFKESSSNLNSPTISNHIDLHDDDNDNQINKKRVLIPLDYSDDEKDKRSRKDHRLLSDRAKKEELKKLMDKIPAEHERLFIWNIKWKYLSESALDKIIQFANKKIIEFLGQPDSSLTKFVKSHLKKQLPPNDLVNELEPVLDNEALTFVMKIWRMLIFETEGRSKYLI